MRKILFLLLSLLFGSLFSSCNTTKRAEKRIYKITEKHPELIRKDSLKIDTVFIVPVPEDSVIFALDTIVENQTHTIRTERGEFGITILPSKEVKVEYFPENVEVAYRDNMIYDRIVIEQPRERWRDVLLACIIAFIGMLFLKMFFESVMK